MAWGHWLAEALEMPYTRLAENGARAEDVPDQMRGSYDLACVWVGANNVMLRWDPEVFDQALGRITRLRAKLVFLTLPLCLSRKDLSAELREANTLIREHAWSVIELEDLWDWRYFLPDRVHLTALGQLAVAQRAMREMGVAVPEVERREGVCADALHLVSKWPYQRLHYLAGRAAHYLRALDMRAALRLE